MKHIGFLSFGHWTPLPQSQTRTAATRFCRPSGSPSRRRSSAPTRLRPRASLRPPALFGGSYAAEPDKLIEQLKGDEATAEADTILLTVPNQLGVDYNAHVLEAILKYVVPGLGWR
jgi:hypothetical protein